MPDIIGKNGSYANIHAGMKSNDDGSITMFATINDEIPFQCQYVAIFRSPENIQELRKDFRQAVQEKVNSMNGEPQVIEMVHSETLYANKDLEANRAEIIQLLKSLGRLK